MTENLKTYLGDGVYVSVETGDGIVKLTTEGGMRITNTIYLEPEVVVAFEKWLQRLKDREPPHHTGCVCADCSGAELTAEND